MAIAASSVVTYQSRLIDSGNAKAIFKVTTTTTVTTAPDSPVGTVITESSQFESVDYTSLYQDIANALNPGSTTIGTILSDIAQASENIARAAENTSQSLTNINNLAQGSGIHMKGPLDWLGFVSIYKLYVENVGPENVTLQGLIEYKAKIDGLPKEFY
jgi:hypothetical protein